MPRNVPSDLKQYTKKPEEIKIEGEKPSIFPNPSEPYYYQRMYLKAFGALIEKEEKNDELSDSVVFPFFDTIDDSTYREAMDLMIHEEFNLENCVNGISVKSAKAVAAMMESSINGLMEEYQLDGDVAPEKAQLRDSEARLYDDIRKKLNPKKVIKSVDSLVSKIASALKPTQLQDYFDVQENKLFPEEKVTEEGLKSFAKVIRDVNKLREQRPWYERWFFKDTCKDVMKKTCDILVKKGMDAKKLQAYINSSDEKSEAKLESLWEASKGWVDTLRDMAQTIDRKEPIKEIENVQENQNLENQLKDEIEMKTLIFEEEEKQNEAPVREEVAEV